MRTARVVEMGVRIDDTNPFVRAKRPTSKPFLDPQTIHPRKLIHVVRNYCQIVNKGGCGNPQVKRANHLPYIFQPIADLPITFRDSDIHRQQSKRLK